MSGNWDADDNADDDADDDDADDDDHADDDDYKWTYLKTSGELCLETLSSM